MNRTVSRTIFAALLIALAFAAVAASALTFDQVPITNWVGAGSSKSAMIVDFGTKAFAFGYQYDGVKTSADMLNAIVQGTDLICETSFEGAYVDNMSYQGYTGANPGWTAFWVSADGVNWITPANYGFATRTLTNGSWDGWTWGGGTMDSWPGPAPDVSSVPEPASLAALAFGLSAIIARRRKR
jgi:hypothetical protein